MLAAGQFGDEHGATVEAPYLRETADFWNSQIEAWTHVVDTNLARQIGAPGCYVRIADYDGARRGASDNNAPTFVHGCWSE